MWTEYEKLGQKWASGQLEIGEFNGKRLNPKQVEFVNSKERYLLASGGFRSGKTMSFMVKLALMSICFPKNWILLGRQSKALLEKNTLRDFFDICPRGTYEYKVGPGLIEFGNGSLITLLGLESSASGSDIEGAEQKIKGMNLGSAYIDQAEEVEASIIEHLSGRLSNTASPINQIVMTANPANYWALDPFKLNPKPGHKLIEMSMFDNKENLPAGYLEDQLTKGEMYVNRFVYGKWDLDNLSDKTVFGEDFIRDQNLLTKEPIRTLDGIAIYQEPQQDHEYQMGVDTSEASEDPCAIIVADKNTGEVCAVYSSYVPVEKQVDIAQELGFKYNRAKIVVEANNTSGGAFIQEIKKKYPNLYTRKRINKWDDKETSMLGFQTNVGTKTILIEHFKKLTAKRFPKLRHRPLVNEFKTFVWSDEARQKGAGGQRGFHDDLVMACLLAFHEVTEQSYTPEETIRERKKWQEFKLYGTRYN